MSNKCVEFSTHSLEMAVVVAYQNEFGCTVVKVLSSVNVFLRFFSEALLFLCVTGST